MGIRKIAAVGMLGYGIYRLFGRPAQPNCAAFAPGEGNSAGFGQVRNAGPDAMASASRHWDRTDQASDESFPASDPPATY